MSRRMLLSGLVITILALGQIAAAIVFYDAEVDERLVNLGWLVMWLSAIFGWLPIITMRRKGEVRGRSYIHTTRLVEDGPFAIVRHPQYLAGVLIAIALAMISPHWSVIALGLASIPVYVLTTYEEERDTIEKFGEAYRAYMRRVPRLNFLLGIVRLLRRRKGL